MGFVHLPFHRRRKARGLRCTSFHHLSQARRQAWKGLVRCFVHLFSLRDGQSLEAVGQMKRWTSQLDGRILSVVIVEVLLRKDLLEEGLSAEVTVEEAVAEAPDQKFAGKGEPRQGQGRPSNIRKALALVVAW